MVYALIDQNITNTKKNLIRSGITTTIKETLATDAARCVMLRQWHRCFWSYAVGTPHGKLPVHPDIHSCIIKTKSHDNHALIHGNMEKVIQTLFCYHLMVPSVFLFATTGLNCELFVLEFGVLASRSCKCHWHLVFQNTRYKDTVYKSLLTMGRSAVHTRCYV
jgi:hypothetical protein